MQHIDQLIKCKHSWTKYGLWENLVSLFGYWRSSVLRFVSPLIMKFYHNPFLFTSSHALKVCSHLSSKLWKKLEVLKWSYSGVILNLVKALVRCAERENLIWFAHAAAHVICGETFWSRGRNAAVEHAWWAKLMLSSSRILRRPNLCWLLYNIIF